MKASPLVALVVPVHNGKEHTQEFLESVRKVNYPDYKVIIVDDGSTDGTGEMISREFPDVILLKGDGNLWWSGAINMGIEKAIEMDFKYVLIIDNDTVVDPEFISALVDTAERNPHSITTGKTYQYHDPKRLEQAGYKKRWLRLLSYPAGWGEIDEGQYDRQQDLPCANMNVLINTSIFKDIGMMDAENLPLYGADQDFSLRARKRGYNIIYEPRSKIWHKRRATANKETPDTTSLWSRLIYLTTNLKSPVRWHTQKTFIFRHSPKYEILPKLVLYFWTLVMRILKNDTS